MQRVMVMGGPGSGKSTLARKVGSALNLPVYHLDRYFWKPGWVQSAWDEFAEDVRAIADQDRWVIDGNYSPILSDRLCRADTVVYLDLPLRVRLPRVLRRRIEYRGRSREDMGVDCPERIDWVFLKQVVRFNSARHLEAISASSTSRKSEIPLNRLKSVAEVESFLQHLSRGCYRIA